MPTPIFLRAHRSATRTTELRDARVGGQASLRVRTENQDENERWESWVLARSTGCDRCVVTRRFWLRLGRSRVRAYRTNGGGGDRRELDCTHADGDDGYLH